MHQVNDINGKLLYDYSTKSYQIISTNDYELEEPGIYKLKMENTDDLNGKNLFNMSHFSLSENLIIIPHLVQAKSNYTIVFHLHSNKKSQLRVNQHIGSLIIDELPTEDTITTFNELIDECKTEELKHEIINMPEI